MPAAISSRHAAVPAATRIDIACTDDALATVSLTAADEVHIAVALSGGNVKPDLRRELVDAVFARSEVRQRHRVRATLPLGDPELLDAFGRHCHDVRTRAAGASCLLDARQ